MLTRLYSDKNRRALKVVLSVAGTLLMNGCASIDKRAENSVDIGSKASEIDPYENFNRTVYEFNDGLDKYVLKPVADGYKFITPDFVETGISNFFNNLKGINVVLNDMLQGKFRQGASDAGRFLANTTIGVGGLVDVASELGLEHNVEDFGQTLAVWGVGQGPYLVLPVLGPTTVRDSGAIIVDRAANPGTYVPFTGVLEGISDRANAEEALNFIEEAALDQYVFTRESFLQHRQFLINDGQTDNSDFDIDVAIDATNDVETETYQNIESDIVITSETDEGIEPSISASESATGLNSAFDNMVLSYEQAWIKVEQLHQQTMR